MTQPASTHDQTSRPEMQHNQKPDHNHYSTAQTSYHHPLKIKNCRTHLCITIRWPAEAGQARHANLISNSPHQRRRGC
jgi:hypothetical protein